MDRLVQLLPNSSINPELFVEFSFEACRVLFLWLGFSAGEFPLERMQILAVALADEELRVLGNDPSGDANQSHKQSESLRGL